MTQSTMYQFRLDADEKRQAFRSVDELGIKPAQAIRLFLRPSYGNTVYSV
ncbi:MAG: type II toxin-antitoxin system RelB/DinJ family antitoxin [Moraxella osloensis]